MVIFPIEIFRWPIEKNRGGRSFVASDERSATALRDPTAHRSAQETPAHRQRALDSPERAPEPRGTLR